MRNKGSDLTDQPNPDEFINIATVYSLPEAAVLQSLLSGTQIPYYAANHATLNGVPCWFLALGGIEFRVHPAGIDDVIELMTASDTGWTLPPRSYASQWLLNIVLGVIVALYGVVPPPRLRGLYAWTSPPRAT